MAGSGIGYFGDERLRKNGALMVQRVIERQGVCIRKLGDDRSEQVKFRRFLYNEAVTVTEMVAHRATFVAAAAQGRHVLAVQDTSEINYQAQSGRKQQLGKVGNGSDIGLFVHPVLGVDAQSEECLGLIDMQVWRRTKGKAANYKRLPIEQKESYRWLRGGNQAKAVLADAAMVTILDDREGDIYEKWARLPDARTHLLTRACRDRSLADGGKLEIEFSNPAMDEVPPNLSALIVAGGHAGVSPAQRDAMLEFVQSRGSRSPVPHRPREASTDRLLQRLAEASARVEDLEQSLSWRITGPLRWLNDKLLHR